MNFVLEKKEYLVGVTIYEARNIEGKDSAGTSDPFIKIICAGQEQQSQKKYEQNSAVWNQSFTFNSVKLNQYELETFEINIQLKDHNAILVNELIGQYSIGLSTLHRALNHEFYKVWVGLFHPDDHNKVCGYLQLSCFIVGPNERPPVHASEDEQMDEGERQDTEQNEEEIAKRIESMKRTQGVTLVNTANVIHKTYQLSAVIMKAENLPCFEGSEANPFLSMRVNGCVLTTKMVSKNNNPQFNNRLQFPITSPILNDKIITRLWSKVSMRPDIFIANIPEHPQQNDFFNLSKLMSSDGHMPARWITLYGVPPEERGPKTKSLKEGTAYLGRVLIAMNLSPNEFPNLGSSSSGPLKEPKNGSYELWVDVYEWINCDFQTVEKGKLNFFVVVTIGSTKAEAVKAKKSHSGDKLTFKNKQVETVKINFPSDMSQVPDIIINFYCNNGDTVIEENRIGYLRIPAADVSIKTPKPSWRRIKSPFSGKNPDPGQILMNCQFIKVNPNMPDLERKIKMPSGSQNFQFYCQILNGFEIAGPLPREKLNTRVSIQIGVQYHQKGKASSIQTEPKRGRYPMWNFFKFDEILLQKELGLEPDMKISVENVTNKDQKGEVIGECCVPLESISQLNEKPQFFNLINEHGMFVGQVLCNFYLKYFEKDSRKNPKDWKITDQPEHKSIVKKFEYQTQYRQGKDGKDLEYDIHFAVFGIRNLIKEAVRPVITIRLSEVENNGNSQQKVITPQIMDDHHLDNDEQTSPNFCKIEMFHRVKLPNEPLMWPFLEIEVKDEGEKGMFNKKGCEECYTTICLIPYSNIEILPTSELNHAMAQLSRNQHELSYIQEQIHIKQEDTPKLAVNMGNLTDNAEDNHIMNETFSKERGTANPQHHAMRKQGTVDPQKVRQTNFKADIYKDIEGLDYFNETLDVERIALLQKDKNEIEAGFHGQDVVLETEEEQGLQIEMTTKNINLQMGVLCDPKDIIEIKVTQQMKQDEEDRRLKEKQEINNDISTLATQLNLIDNEDLDEKRIFQMKIMNLQDKLQELEDERMTDQKFWGLTGMNEDDEFDYGRDVVREGNYDKMLCLPYKEMPLFTNGEWYQTYQTHELVSVSGILRSGVLTGAVLKADIKIQERILQDNDDQDEEEDIENPLEEEPFDQKLCESLDDDDFKEAMDINLNNRDKNTQVSNLMNLITTLIPYDITRRSFIEQLCQDIYKSFRLRLYIISGQNLSAMSSVIDLKSKLAGQNALCTANPYLVVKIGSKFEKGGKGKTFKEINDREKAFQGNLNPEFLSVYEIDVKFPKYQLLCIQVYDKQGFNDQLIGETYLDLENRRSSDLLNINRMALQLELKSIMKQMKHVKAILSSKKGRGGLDREDIEDLNKSLNIKKDQIQKLQKKCKEVDQIMVPIEFRELTHPNKQQVQGILECWFEIITEEDSRRIPVSKMKQQQSQLYEIRVVIWETRNVPLVGGDKVDQFVKCTFDPTGWSEDEVTKETDTHMACKDGRGQFNWRMKFDLKIPCEFPRLKFQVLDAGMLGEQAIGETTLSLKNTLKRLKKEGQVSVPKSFVTFINPIDPDEERGMMLFSMDILLKEDAKQDPVGEAQEEPNKNPFLKKPIAGRGLGDALTAIGISAPSFSWNPFGKWLWLVVIAGIIIISYWLKVMFT